MTNWNRLNPLLDDPAEPTLPFWQGSGSARFGPQDRQAGAQATAEPSTGARTERSEGGRRTTVRAPRRFGPGGAL
jgi:hypothetical protein